MSLTCVTHIGRRPVRFGLIGELSSTLCASSLENLATVSGSHSLAEAVLLLSLTLLRLISSNHCGIPPLSYIMNAHSAV